MLVGLTYYCDLKDLICWTLLLNHAKLYSLLTFIFTEILFLTEVYYFRDLLLFMLFIDMNISAKSNALWKKRKQIGITFTLGLFWFQMLD